MVACGVCGHDGRAELPFAWIEAADRLAIVVHDQVTAFESLDDFITRLVSGSDVDADGEQILRTRSVNVNTYLELGTMRSLDADGRERALESQRRRDQRSGVMGRERVQLMVRDQHELGMLLLDEYERSDDFLANEGYWEGAMPLLHALKDALRGQPPEVDASDATDAEDHDVDLAEQITSSLPTIDVADLRTFLRTHALIALAADPTQREAALAIAEDLGVDPATFDGLVDILGAVVEMWSDLDLEPTPDVAPADSDQSRARRTGEELEVDSIVELAWGGAMSKHLHPALAEISDLLNDGKAAEAHVVASGILREEVDEESDFIARLMRGCAEVTLGYQLATRRLARLLDESPRIVNRDVVVSVDTLRAIAATLAVIGDAAVTDGDLQHATERFRDAYFLFVKLGAVTNALHTATRWVSLLLYTGNRDAAHDVAREALAFARDHGDTQDYQHDLWKVVAITSGPELEFTLDLEESTVQVVRRDVFSPTFPLSLRRPATVDPPRVTPGRGSGVVVSLVPVPEDALVSSIVVANDGRNHVLLALLRATTVGELATAACDLFDVDSELGVSQVPSWWWLLTFATLAAEDDDGTTTRRIRLLASGCRTAAMLAESVDKAVAHLRQEARDFGVEAIADDAPSSTMFWQYAATFGRLGLDMERRRARNGRFWAGNQQDFGTALDALIGNGPLAMEAIGDLDGALDAYRSVFDNLERELANVGGDREGGPVPQRQIRLTTPYVRASRCAFSRYERDLSVDDALLAADLLERHRVRRMQHRVHEELGPERLEWLKHPFARFVDHLQPGAAVACLGVHPYKDRIPGRWMVVGSNSQHEVWTSALDDPEALRILTSRMGISQQRLAAEFGASDHSAATLGRLVEEITPYDVIDERLRFFWHLVAPDDSDVHHLWLTTESYALELPWAAAALLSSDVQVSILPAAVLGAPPISTRGPAGTGLSVTMVVQAEPVLQSAAQRVSEALSRSPRVEFAASGDVVVLLGHGHRDRGMRALNEQLDRDLAQRTPPRVVVLVGCWSASMRQDSESMEIDGLVMDLLDAGTEAVVASIWPLILPVAELFVVQFVDLMAAGIAPTDAFHQALAALRDRQDVFHHPALWSGLTLFAR